jgi:hypothetical protein
MIAVSIVSGQVIVSTGFCHACWRSCVGLWKSGRPAFATPSLWYITALSIQHLGNVKMMIDPDRKTYWELLETLSWIVTRDDRRVAALQECSDQDKLALALWGMKVRMVIHSPPGSWGRNRGADLETPAPQGNKGAPHPLDDVLAKVQSGRVGVTTIRCDGGTNEQIPVPLAELNDLKFLLMPSHPVAPVGLWLRSRWTLVWRSPQFLRAAGASRLRLDLRDVDGLTCATTQSRILPAMAYALATSRHMHQYGTTGEQLAAVAVETPEWALLNRRHGEKPLTIDEVLSARMVSYPFTVRDCCLITDGGGAVIMTTAERARSLKKPPVYVLGCGQAITHASISSIPDLTATGARTSGRAAYATARLGPGDIDIVELYDAFTPSHSTRSFSARSRLLPERGAGPFVSDGHFEPGAVCRSTPMVVASLTPSRHVRIVPADRGGATATP